MLTPEEKELLLRSIWTGRTTERRLPEILYFDTGNNLQTGLIRGFGSFTIGSPGFQLINDLNTNIYFFSAAKTFQQVKVMQTFVFDADGFLKSFPEFRRDVNPIYNQYNIQWQRTEFDTTIGQAQSASDWQDIQADKDVLPLLKYQTAGDEKVRPTHADLDGIVRPVDDPFWNEHMPKNGYNCRCRTIQLEQGEERLTNLKGKTFDIDPLFKMNPGKSRFVFQEQGRNLHPYFKVEPEFILQKNNNFGLPPAVPVISTIQLESVI